jgi:hypothetical protein
MRSISGESRRMELAMYCACKGAFEAGMDIHIGLSASQSTIFNKHCCQT